jgi:hypothetical protein
MRSVGHRIARVALSAIACLALLAGSAPASPALGSAARKTAHAAAPAAALKQTDCSGVIPCIAQRTPQDSSDKGVFDCFPASVAMALEGLQAEGVVSSGLDVSYQTVRQSIRNSQPDTTAGIRWPAVMSVVQNLTSNAVAADGTAPSNRDWQAFLADQFGRGYPVVATILNWHLLTGAWPGTYAHSILVTGIDAQNVYYIDPWDGRSYAEGLDAFGTAWTGSGYQAVVFTSQSSAQGAPDAPTPQALLPTNPAYLGWQGDGHDYQVELWTDKGDVLKTPDWTDQTAWNTDLAANPDLRWRVRARSASGVIGPWSMPGPEIAGSKVPPTPTPTLAPRVKVTPTPTPGPQQIKAPAAPTDASGSVEDVDCADGSGCDKFDMSWSYDGTSPAGFHLYTSSRSECIVEGCTAGTQCEIGDRTLYASVPGSARSYEATLEMSDPSNCWWVSAYNSAGESALVYVSFGPCDPSCNDPGPGSDWPTYQGDGYVVDYPDAPRTQTVSSSQTGGMYSATASYYSEGPDSNPSLLYAVVHYRFASSVIASGVDYMTLLKQYLASYYSSNTSVSVADHTVAGRNGLLVTVQGNGASGQIEILMIGADLYMAYAVHLDTDTTLDAARFFQSFQLT